MGKVARPRGFSTLLRNWLGNQHHLWMWDYNALADELRQAGFSEIRPAAWGDHPDPLFAKVEHPDRWIEAVGIHCVKPKPA
jgi:hypothetical protein